MSVPGHTIPSIKDGEDGIKKGYPPLLKEYMRPSSISMMMREESS
jgi:hypothetical protein